MYIVNITKAIKTMSINEIRGSILGFDFFKKISYNSMKHLNKKDLTN